MEQWPCSNKRRGQCKQDSEDAQPEDHYVLQALQICVFVTFESGERGRKSLLDEPVWFCANSQGGIAYARMALIRD